MKRFAPAVAALGMLFALWGSAHGENEAGISGLARPIAPDTVGIGTLVPDLRFEDLDGKAGKLSDYADHRGLVIAFNNLTCPVCRKYALRLGSHLSWFAIRKDFDIPYLIVNPSATDTPEAIHQAGKQNGWSRYGRIVHDRDQALTKALGARSTAEVFVLDSARTLVYRGAVDDQHGVGFSRDKAQHDFLDHALRALAAGRRPIVEATTVPGCVLSAHVEMAPPDAPTYHEHVERILQRRCTACHRNGGPAPFALTSHALAKDNAAMLKWVVDERRMPPWNAGPKSLPLANDGHLTEHEHQVITSWVQAGSPKGPPEAAPTPQVWPDGWQIGTPDAIVQIPHDQPIPAEGVLKYRNVTVRTDFGEDKWVAAYEIRPTAPQVVHHVLVFARYPKEARRMRAQPRYRNGIDGYFAAMVPGQTAYRFPASSGRFLPKGTRLRFQLHYTPNGTATVDRTQLGLVFTKQRPAHEVRSLGVHNTNFRIPAGAPNHRLTSAKVLHRRSRLLGFTPHMHLRGKAFRFELERPDGVRQVLVDVPRYDFNWQFHYALREPMDVPAGSRIHVIAHYDNSADNPFNPDPSKAVRWGDQTFDEMLIGYVEWHPAPK